MLDCTLGEIMAEPLGKQFLDRMVPELMANPMIEYAKRMTLAEGISPKAACGITMCWLRQCEPLILGESTKGKGMWR